MGSYTVYTGYERTLNVYSVAINNLVGPTGLTGTGPNSGGSIDNTSQPYYPTYAATLSQALDKERGNMRYEQIVWNLEQYATIFAIDDWIATGATVNTPATSFSFQVTFDKTDYVIDPNQPTFNDIQSITRLVSTALSQSYTERRIYYDPSQVLTPSGFGIRGMTDAIVTADVMGGGSVATIEGNMVVSLVTTLTL